MNVATIKQKCLEQIEFMRDKDHFYHTAWVPLETVGDNNWAIVFGYCGGYDPEDADVVEDGDGYCLNGKVAFQSRNAGMSEYEIDWLMPWNEDGDCYGETSLTGNDDFDVDWLIEQWTEIKKVAENFIGKY